MFTLELPLNKVHTYSVYGNLSDQVSPNKWVLKVLEFIINDQQMNSIGDILPSVADTISLSLSDRAHCALPTTLGSLSNPNWERYTRLSLVAYVT